MKLEFLNYLLAFIEGFALILSPCILPILPIMLSGTIEGGKRRPLGIILGFILVFALFTAFSHWLVKYTGLNLDILRDVAFGLIVLFGVVMISDYLTEKFSHFTQRFAALGANAKFFNRVQDGFVSGFLLGAVIGIIWTPCAGPILAAAIIQIATQKSALSTFIALLCFALGSAVPMLIIALAGRKLISSINFLKQRTVLLRKIFGVIIIVAALSVAIITRVNPSFFAFNVNSNSSKQIENTSELIDKVGPYQAPPIVGISSWINSAPLTLEQLKGKVVLIDFWTYSCINCIRTLPYLIKWDKAYRDQGLVIIGVHTPEFEFEKNVENVKRATEKYGIKYPVALDNQYATWTNYNNHYWPAHFLINKNGMVVYTHFGEGDYAITEHNIRVLLGLNPNIDMTETSNTANEFYSQTPETYLGYARANRFSSSEAMIKNATAYYTLSSKLQLNAWALQGSWLINAEKITAIGPQASITLHFHASHVYAVMGSANNEPITVKILLNGKLLEKNAGNDVTHGILEVTAERLYEIVNFEQPTEGEITLIINKPGLEMYTFTFG